jgi:hypothetical protein
MRTVGPLLVLRRQVGILPCIGVAAIGFGAAASLPLDSYFQAPICVPLRALLRIYERYRSPGMFDQTHQGNP